MGRLRGVVTVLALVAFCAPSYAAPDLGNEQQREAGRVLYDQYCSQCHGDDGDGKGVATPRLKPEPRDFTSGKYKFRTTPSGLLPTDEDIAKVIKDGLPYTSMPGWPNFSETQIQNIIYYLKTFSADFADADNHGQPIDLPQPPPSSEDSIQRGRVVYEEQGCAACHGDLGRGDGMSAPTLTDDWGQHIRPADMTQRWTFRGGPTRKDMFRTFSTGLNGTPMPSYFDSLQVEDRWHLVNYMESLGDGDAPDYASLLMVSYLDDEIDISAGVSQFEAAPKARFPLVGQIVEPGRDFYPSTTSIEVQAIYNRQEIAFLLRWHDMRAETAGFNAPDLEIPPWDEDQPGGAASVEEEEEGDFWGDEVEEEQGDFWGDEAVGEDQDDFWGEGEDDVAAAVGGEFSDAVALQFPSKLPTGIRKPYFLYGDAQHPVDLWFVDLARDTLVQQFIGRGTDSLERSLVDEFEIAAGYDKGEWHVILKRSLRSTGGVTFAPDQYVPFAFSVWDGFNRERGNKRALSAWFYLYVDPPEQVSAVGPMARAGLATLVVELLIIFLIRRRFAGASGARASGAGVPQEGFAK
jgi:mono/diheme cytochrome c family protein